MPASADPKTAVPDSELKSRHRAMWASGDYPSMVETFLLPLGPRLVEAAGIGADMTVLDVAAGTGNASLPAAERGAKVTASDLTPELLEAGRVRAESSGLELDWVEADAENLPFEDESFDVVISAIGAMFAPHHQEVADELVRVCRPGGTIALLSWTPEGMLGALLKTIGPFAPPPPAGAQPPPLWGSEEHLRGLFGGRVDWTELTREMLDITAFERPRDYGEHFKARYGPTIAARANAVKNGRDAEFDEALDRFCDEWNLGSADKARFEQEYLARRGHPHVVDSGEGGIRTLDRGCPRYSLSRRVPSATRPPLRENSIVCGVPRSSCSAWWQSSPWLSSSSCRRCWSARARRDWRSTAERRAWPSARFPALRLLLSDGESIEITGSGQRLDLDEEPVDAFERLDGFGEVRLDLTELEAGPLRIDAFQLHRGQADETYSLELEGETSPRELARYMGRQAAGPLGGVLGGAAAGLIAPAPAATLPIRLEAEIRSEDGRAEAEEASGSVGGIPAGPLAEIVADAVVRRL